jgi:putative ATP-binding cassette transporter
VFDDRRRDAAFTITPEMPADVVVRTVGLRVTTPDGRRVLVDDLSFDLKRGDRLLLVGASGTGKSSVLRALAGLWPPCAGSVGMQPESKAFFVPQKPYSPLGTLRDQLTYPEQEASGEKDALLLELLKEVGLDSWADASLDTNLDWTTTLSLGEQQRLSFARLLYNEPDLAILDEATSAMDIATERRMYALMHARLTHTTLISVGHRPSLLEHHDFRLRLGVTKDDDVLQPISQEDRDTAKSAALL